MAKKKWAKQAKVQLKAAQIRLADSKECEEQPPRSEKVGIVMAETFKKMETAHTKDDKWGNYKEYSSPIRYMQCLMKSVLENSSQESLGNENRPCPTYNMGVTGKGLVAHENNVEMLPDKITELDTEKTCPWKIPPL